MVDGIDRKKPSRSVHKTSGIKNNQELCRIGLIGIEMVQNTRGNHFPNVVLYSSRMIDPFARELQQTYSVSR